MFDGRMSWGETWDLTLTLLADPSSAVAAAQAGWAYPMSREAIVLADLYDLTLQAHASRRTSATYPRGWDLPKPKIGDVRQMSQEQVHAHLAALGHGVASTDDDGANPAETKAISPTPSSTQTTGL